MSYCLIVQAIHPSGIERLLKAGIETRMASESDMGAVAREIGGAVAVITRDAGLSASAIAAAPGLQVIANHGVGTNKIDLVRAARDGIVTVYTPFANARSVAEHTIMLMLAVAKRALAADRAVRAGDWRFKYTGGMMELHGKTMGIVGFGTIGRMVAETASRGFGMRVVVWSPNTPASAIEAAGVTSVADLAALLDVADVLSLHRPLRSDTRHTIDRAALARMKPDAILVNTARGALVDGAALIEALREKRIGGAGFDVFAVEPLPIDDPLLALDNVVLAPHVAGSTEGALRETADQCADQIIDVLAGRRPPHLVNPAVWERRRR